MTISSLTAKVWPIVAENGANGVDIGRLKVPAEWTLKLVISAFVLGATMYFANYFANASVRSAQTLSERTQAKMQEDLSVIIAKMEGRVDVDALNAKLNEERLAGLKAEIAAMGRRMELMQFEIQSLQKDLNSRR